jgi:hypothetical protein
MMIIMIEITITINLSNKIVIQNKIPNIKVENLLNN